MIYIVPPRVTISALNASGWDADLLVPAGKKIEITDSTCSGTKLTGLMLAMGGEFNV